MNASSASDWQALSELFEHAQELEAPDLASWLGSLQTKAHPLLPRLRRMLEASEAVRTNNFLTQPPRLVISPEPSSPSDWSEGGLIGPYRLMRPLGAGGMAEVWLAARNDGAFTREVAIKLLYRQSASRHRESFAQRFRRERDILAGLNHPHIAGLLDAGVTPSGQPWLALEYVHGEPLTAWCDRVQLDLRGRVQLFLQVLQAVQHAHANLVIHRDLKPANILVTPQGQAQLLDFGIAKLIEAEGTGSTETELTRVAGRPLTPQYASPEQVRGLPLSTASDGYSLGVILYELVCGQRPYELKLESAAQLENAILEVDPRAPSRRSLSEDDAKVRGTSLRGLRKALANDLDAIVLKAMSKEPGQRYGSIEAFRLDLKRWLEGEPVQAKPPTTAYWLRKFVARNRLGVGLGAGALVSLIAVTAIAVVLGLHAREESARAVAARDFLIDIFRQADPDLSHGADITAKQLLDQGKKIILGTLKSQPLLQAELLRGISDAQFGMAEYHKADETWSHVVNLYRDAGAPREAALNMAEQAEVARAMGDTRHSEDLLAMATQTFPGYARDPAFMAQYSLVQGANFSDASNYPAARAKLESALRFAVEAFGDHDERTVNTIRLLSDVEGRLGISQSAINRLDQLMSKLAQTKDVKPWTLIGVQSDQAYLEYASGRFRFASGHLEYAATQCEQILNPIGQTCTNLRNRQAVVVLLLGYYEKAMELLPSIMVLAQKSDSPRRRMDAWLAVCRVLALNGKKYEEQEACTRKLTQEAQVETSKLPDSVKVWSLLIQAEALMHENQPESALEVLHRAETVFDASDHADRRQWARLKLFQGLALQGLGQPAAALANIKTAVAEYTTLLGPDHPLTLLVAVHQGRSLWSLRQPNAALSLLDHALPILLDAMGPQAPTSVKLVALRNELAKNAAEGAGSNRKVDIFL